MNRSRSLLSKSLVRIVVSIVIVSSVIYSGSLPTMRAIAQRGSLLNLLPSANQVSPDVYIVDDGFRSVEEQATTFTNPDQAARLLSDWGWKENAFRVYETSQRGVTGLPISSASVSLTRFDSSAGAMAALPYFLEDRASALGQDEATSLQAVGDESRAIAGFVEGGWDYTLYARSGPFLMRISATSASGAPFASPEEIAQGIIDRVAGQSVSEDSRQSASALLPETLRLDHAACFRIDGEGVLDFPALVERFPGVPNADATLQALGWAEGAYRQFGCDNPPPGTVGWIDVSAHRFRDATSAAAAVPFFASSRALGTTLQSVPAIDLGEATAALTGPAINGTEYTLYLSSGSLLIRVTGVAPAGDPQPNVEYVATALHVVSLLMEPDDSPDQPVPAPATVAPTPPSIPTPIAIPMPTATPIPTATIAPTPTAVPRATAVPTATRTPVPTATPPVIETPVRPSPTPRALPTTTPDSLSCTEVELYPGYPGYRGYVAGINGPGEVACLEDLVADNPRFNMETEDAANIAAARAIGLNGLPSDWTWENWMAIEAARGLPVTCYSCLILQGSSAQQVADYDSSDSRLWFGTYGSTSALNAWSPSSYYVQHFAFDHRLRGLVGLLWPGHYTAPELASSYDALFAEYEAAGISLLDPALLWDSMLSQGGYVPTPPTAHLEDQLYTVRVAAEAICVSMVPDVCEPWLIYYDGVEQTYINEISTGRTDLPYADWLRENRPHPL